MIIHKNIKVKYYNIIDYKVKIVYHPQLLYYNDELLECLELL